MDRKQRKVVVLTAIHKLCKNIIVLDPRDSYSLDVARNILSVGLPLLPRRSVVDFMDHRLLATSGQGCIIG